MAKEIQQEGDALRQDVEPAANLNTNELEVSLESYLEGWRFYGTIFGDVLFTFT